MVRSAIKHDFIINYKGGNSVWGLSINQTLVYEGFGAETAAGVHKEFEETFWDWEGVDDDKVDLVVKVYEFWGIMILYWAVVFKSRDLSYTIIKFTYRYKYI